MSGQRFRKADILLLTILGLLILLLFLFQEPWKEAAGGMVVITVDGEEFGRFPLAEDTVIPITDADGTTMNTLTITGGYAKMTEADCPDQLCVHQKKIHGTKETIVCLPNRVVVSVENGAENDLDAVVR